MRGHRRDIGKKGDAQITSGSRSFIYFTFDRNVYSSVEGREKNIEGRITGRNADRCRPRDLYIRLKAQWKR